MNSGGFIPDNGLPLHCAWRIMAEKFLISAHNKNPEDGAVL
jgi:hypothetical protein